MEVNPKLDSSPRSNNEHDKNDELSKQLKPFKKKEIPLNIIEYGFNLMTMIYLLITLLALNLSVNEPIYILLTLFINIPNLMLLQHDFILYKFFGPESNFYYETIITTISILLSDLSLKSLLFILAYTVSMSNSLLFVKERGKISKDEVVDKKEGKINKIRLIIMLLIDIIAILGLIFANFSTPAIKYTICVIIIIIATVLIDIRDHTLSTTFNFIDDHSAIKLSSFINTLLLIIIIKYQINNPQEIIFLTFVLLRLLIVIIMWFTSIKYNLESGLAERGFIDSMIGLSKLLGTLFFNNSIQLIVVLLLTAYFSISYDKKLLTYDIIFNDSKLSNAKIAYEEITNNYSKFAEVTNAQWFKTLFLPIIKDITAVKSITKNIYLSGGYFLNLVGNGIHGSVIIFEDNLLLFLSLIFICLNLIQLFKFEEKINKIMRNELYWVSLISLSLLLIIMITTYYQLNYIILTTTFDTKVNIKTEKEGIFIYISLSILTLIYLYELVRLMYNKVSLKEIANKRNKNTIFTEFRKGGIGLIRQISRISNILFIMGIISIIILSFRGGPINNVKVNKSNEKYVPISIMNSVDKTDILEAKLLNNMPKKLINVIWFSQGLNYAGSKIPCIDVGVKHICINDLIGNGINAVWELIQQGIETSASTAIDLAKSANIDDFNFLETYLDKLIINLPHLEIKLSDYVDLGEIKIVIPVWFKITAIMIGAIGIILMIFALKNRILAFIKFPLYSLMSSLTISIISIITNTYNLISKSGYEWEIKYGENLSLYLLGCVMLLASFIIRYYEVYNEIDNEENNNDKNVIEDDKEREETHEDHIIELAEEKNNEENTIEVGMINSAEYRKPSLTKSELPIRLIKYIGMDNNQNENIDTNNNKIQINDIIQLVDTIFKNEYNFFIDTAKMFELYYGKIYQDYPMLLSEKVKYLIKNFGLDKMIKDLHKIFHKTYDTSNLNSDIITLDVLWSFTYSMILSKKALLYNYGNWNNIMIEATKSNLEWEYWYLKNEFKEVEKVTIIAEKETDDIKNNIYYDVCHIMKLIIRKIMEVHDYNLILGLHAIYNVCRNTTEKLLEHHDKQFDYEPVTIDFTSMFSLELIIKYILLNKPKRYRLNIPEKLYPKISKSEKIQSIRNYYNNITDKVIKL